MIMDNKYYGLVERYTPIKEEGRRVIVKYGMESTGDGIHCTWYEVYFNKKENPNITFDDVKNAIITDINVQTKETILAGFDYIVKSGSDQGKKVKVWLSEDNQTDIERLAYASGVTFPVRHKIAEDDEGNAVYEEFANSTELKNLSDLFTLYIHECLDAGWARKDAIDWNEYLPFFPVVKN